MAVLNIHHKRCLIVVMTADAGWDDYNRRYIEVLLGNTGIHCEQYVVNHDSLQDDLRHLIQIAANLHERYDFVVTTNRYPSALIRKILDDGQNFECYSPCRIPVVTWYVDNVAYHISTIVNTPLPQEIPLLTDRRSITSVLRTGATEQPKIFLPMWGPKRETTYTESDERAISLVFTGDVYELTDPENLHQELNTLTATAVDILLSIIEDMRDDKGTIDCFHLCLDRTMEHGIPENAVQIFSVADRWLRNFRRKSLLMNIKETSMVILGEIHDPEVAAKDNIEARGRVSISDGEPIMRQAKILLGDFANFVEGVELRPAMANVNGCAFACEPNTFMKRDVPASSFIDLLSDECSPDDVLADALNNEEYLAETSYEFGMHYDAQLKNDLFSFK